MCLVSKHMIGPTFKINSESLEFSLNTKTKQWHIRKNHDKTILILSKVKGDTVIKFLELLKKESEE